jgi:hypothetical protein
VNDRVGRVMARVRLAPRAAPGLNDASSQRGLDPSTADSFIQARFIGST